MELNRTVDVRPDQHLKQRQGLGNMVRRVGRALLLTGTLILILVLAGASTPTFVQQRRAALTMTVAGSTFSITGWSVHAVAEKLEAALADPAGDIPLDEGADLVRSYLDRAHDIARLEAEIEQGFSEGKSEAADLSSLQAEVVRLRAQQREMQPIVEQIIESQVSAELAALGVTALGRTFPPVQFTFTEPPKKLVISPRDRIATAHYRMVVPEFSVAQSERVEEEIRHQHGMSAYVTSIGGMGAFPAMVVERGNLPWIISTVAHEWTHNYLFLFPLGLSYNRSPELTIINETVAEIVGNEVGRRVLERYYPDLVPPEPDGDRTESEAMGIPPSGPMPFDFRSAMRQTRLRVDALLAEGRIDEAEAYMEQRRRIFVDNGYPLRVLNQAYFAFHGSYGTSAASSDPLGPKLFHLRELSEGIPSFLRTMRGITSLAKFEQVYAQQGGMSGSEAERAE